MKIKQLEERWWGIGVYSFKCPGCGLEHIIYTNPANPSPYKGNPCWGFDGNMDTPSFSPSIMVRTGKYVEGLNPEQIEHCLALEAEGHFGLICHSTVIQGMINFISDCTHAYVNQSMPLPEIEKIT